MSRWPIRAILSLLLGCLLALVTALIVTTSASGAPKPANAPLFTYGSL